jgi:hypothetical protein
LTDRVAYNAAGLLDTVSQEHDGSVDANTLSTQYEYSDAAHGYRLTAVEYPNGRVVFYDYGTAGSADDCLNRLAAIIDDSNNNGQFGAGDQVLASYQYLGLDRIVVEDYEEAGVKLDLWGGTSGTYSGLDRFNRVIDQLWTDYAANPDTAIDEYRYEYDAAGNVTSKTNVLDQALTELYSYDDADRLKTVKNGDNTITKESWTLDGTGNMGDANAGNEITASGYVYDRAGNMVADGTKIYEYDAWNRLVAVSADDEGARAIRWPPIAMTASAAASSASPTPIPTARSTPPRITTIRTSR